MTDMNILNLMCAPANYRPNRPVGMRPEAIVLHRSGGTADQIRARFLDATSAISAHYVVTIAGSVEQYVTEQDTAFHAGVVINPTWKLLKPKVNPNFYTIGIELEGSAGEAILEDQADACAELIAEIAARQNIVIDDAHVVLHSEIRASRNCPGTGLIRSDLVERALLVSASLSVQGGPAEVDILRNTNVREGLPSSRVRVVRLLVPGAKVKVKGFTSRGEMVKGNSCWYQEEEGNFFWAGNSSVPQPRSDSEQQPVESIVASTADAVPEGVVSSPAPLPSFPTIGIAQVDQLLSGAARSVALAQAERGTLGIVQDLLTGHGFAKLPLLLSPNYGVYSDATRKALCEFQSSCGLSPDAMLTATTMKQLIVTPAKDPRASQAYLALVLGFPFTGIYRLLALTAQMEGIGRFAALNLNTDSAGLSFGLIQWAQRPGRLIDIVSAFSSENAEMFVKIFGDGDHATAEGLIAHLKKPNGGVSQKTGATTDPAFDLVASPWKERFKAAALQVEFQKAQIETARHAFETSLARLRQFDTAKLVKSDRGVAFMLDVANQFGDGSVQRPPRLPDRGAAGLYRRVLRPGMSETDLLEAIAAASEAAMLPQFQTGVRARRSVFLRTPLLSSQEFESTSAAA